MDQRAKYDDFYSGWRRLRWRFRFDVRYRCRRLHELLRLLDLDSRGARVLDVGFGGGHLLASFPEDCQLVGADVSRSAVTAGEHDPMFARHASIRLVQVDESDPETLPEGPFDFVVSSHTLEHVPDDAASLAAIRRRLTDGGILALFVPIEEPDYIRFHRRAYSVQSICERVEQAGFELLHHEGSMHVNGHVWKLITIPSRRSWPLMAPVVDAVRLASLSALTYPGIRSLDAALDRLGFGPRQALVIARASR